jgi:hypothetical protein
LIDIWDEEGVIGALESSSEEVLAVDLVEVNCSIKV